MILLSVQKNFKTKFLKLNSKEFKIFYFLKKNILKCHKMVKFEPKKLACIFQKSKQNSKIRFFI